MLPGRRDGEGRLYVVGGPVGLSDTYHGGIAVSPLGQVRYFAGIPTKFINGLGVDNTGRLACNVGPATSYLEGLPRNASGGIVYQLDTAPAATDPYLGGLRIGPTGGVYMSSAVPPAEVVVPPSPGPY